jgi:hypothetical protein
VGYTYDQANRLSSIAGQATYTYNGDGLRMSKTVGGSSTVSHAFTWDQAGSLPLLLTDTTQVTGTAATATTAYIYGPGGLPLEQVTPPPPISLVMATSATSAALSTSPGSLQLVHGGSHRGSDPGQPRSQRIPHRDIRHLGGAGGSDGRPEDPGASLPVVPSGPARQHPGQSP